MRIHAGAGDHAEGGRRSDRGARFVKLRMVQRIEEFHLELKRVALGELGQFDDRDVPVELAEADKDA